MLNKAMLCNNTNNTVMKKVKGRSGGLLILVVLILAVAMVLITSALMMTVAARDRYYNSALTSQANLTAASVAKTIASAAEIGDLTKADLNQLVILTQTNNLTVTKNKIDGTLSITPGLEGVNDATGNTKTSFTDLKVEYSNIAKTNFKITVNTYLDAGSATNKSQQAVTIYLTDNNPVYPTGFGATLNVYGNTQIPNITIGTDAPPNAKSNFVTFTGKMTASWGTTKFVGDLIITNKIRIYSNPMTVNGNLVFYGPNAGILSSGSSEGLPFVSLSSYFLDLCESGTRNTFWNEPTDNGNYISTGPGEFKPAGIIIKNTNMKLTSGNASATHFQPGNQIIYTLGTGSVKLDNNPSTGSIAGIPGQFTVQALPAGNTLNDLVTKYTSSSGVVQKSLSFTPPATRAALMTLLGLSPNYAGMSGGDLISKLEDDQSAKLITINSNGKIYVDSVQVTMESQLTAPSYYMNATKIGDPIVFDLTNNNIDLFIVGNGQIDFNNQQAAIRFIRPDGSTHIGRIIFMQDYASIKLKESSGTNADYCGITGVGNVTRYDTEGGTPISDGPYAGAEPYVYVYGFNNYIDGSTSGYLEGYYGLFGPSGYFYIQNSANKLPLVYARFDLNEMRLTGGSSFEISYCPGPGEGTNSDATNINPFVITGYITS